MDDAEWVLSKLLALALEIIEHSLLEALALYCYNSEVLAHHALVYFLDLAREVEVFAVAIDEIAEADAWIDVADIDDARLLAVELDPPTHVPLHVLRLQILRAILHDVRIQIDKPHALLEALPLFGGREAIGPLPGLALHIRRALLLLHESIVFLVVVERVLHSDEVVRQIWSTSDGAYELLDPHEVDDGLVILARNTLDT